MTLGVWVSKDLAHWENRPLPEELPLYDYAPDVRVMGDYVYFCASRVLKNCDRYRTKAVSYTHLDVYKRQALFRHKGSNYHSGELGRF